MKTLILVIVVGLTSLFLMASCFAVIGTALPRQTTVPTYSTKEPTSKPTATLKVKKHKGKSRFCAKRWYC